MATSHPCDVVPRCPVCPLHVAHDHSKLKICVCRACGTSLSIPTEAWAGTENQRLAETRLAFLGGRAVYSPRGGRQCQIRAATSSQWNVPSASLCPGCPIWLQAYRMARPRSICAAEVVSMNGGALFHPPTIRLTARPDRKPGEALIAA
jgi:hypothetical protein